jgi:hypothetical protein
MNDQNSVQSEIKLAPKKPTSSAATENIKSLKDAALGK